MTLNWAEMRKGSTTMDYQARVMVICCNMACCCHVRFACAPFIHFLPMIWLTEWQERISGKRRLPVFILDISIRLPPKRKGGAILKELILDIDFMMKYAPLFAKAAWTTLGIGATGIFLSFLAGLVISVIQYRKIPFLLPLSTAYVELSRNTPLLVQLFFL